MCVHVTGWRVFVRTIRIERMIVRLCAVVSQGTKQEIEHSAPTIQHIQKKLLLE